MINDDQIAATEEVTLEVDAADGVLANDTSSNGPLTVVEGWYRTTGGGQIYFFADGSYDYVSAAGFSGTDTVQYTALDASNAVAGTATLTIDVAATADLPFVSIGTQLGERHVVDAGFPQVGNGIHTAASRPVALTGGGYVITVDYLDQAPGSINQVQTYDANNNLVGTFDPGTFVHNLRTTALTNGDYVVGWDTFDNSGSFTPTLTGHVELFDATGAALAGPVALDLPGGATGINQIAALPGGGFVALQFDSSGQLYATSFDAAGVPANQPFAIGSPPEFRPQLAVLPDGEIVFAQVENGNEIHVQRYDAQGNPIGSEILPPSGVGGIDPGSMSVTPTPNGGFAVSWASRNGPAPRNRVPVVTHVQLVDADGNLVGNQATRDVTYSTLFGVGRPTVVPLADGGFVVDWRGIIDSGLVDEFQAYDASGNALGGISKFTAQTDVGSVLVRVFALPDGGFAVGLADALAFVGIPNNLRIYDNNGNFVGDVRMEDAGDGTGFSQMFLTNLANGNSLILYHGENSTFVSSRDSVQTIKFDTATPVIQTGVTFKENTTGTIPVVVSLPDPDGSEIVQWMNVTGIPPGWTLSYPSVGADGKFVGTATHGGEIDLSLTPPVNFVGSETLTVTVHVVDTGNGSLNESIPVTFDVTVLPSVPHADFNSDGASDVLWRNDTTGAWGWSDIHNNLAWHDLGGSLTAYKVVGTGNFNGDGAADVLFRDDTTGAWGWSDVANNLQWHDLGGSVAAYHVVGVGDFNGDGYDDALFRDDMTGAWGWSDIHNNLGWHDLGGSSTGYNVVGVGDFNGDGATDVLFRDDTTGAWGWSDVHNNLAWHDLGSSSTAYNVVGVGDFNGDGYSDVLWRNNSSGAWGWSDIHNSNTWHDLGGSSTAFKVAAVGDYNGDGAADVLWRNDTNGAWGWSDVNNGNAWHDLGGSLAAYKVVA